MGKGEFISRHANNSRDSEYMIPKSAPLTCGLF